MSINDDGDDRDGMEEDNDEEKFTMIFPPERHESQFEHL
jgi:hypothetical protein